MTAREDRGVQVEARTLSGVLGGRSVEIDGFRAELTGVEHDKFQGASVTVWLGGNLTPMKLDPRDLVTLTDGGAP